MPTAFNNWYELSGKLWTQPLSSIGTFKWIKYRHRPTLLSNWIRYLEYLNCFQTLENVLRRLKKKKIPWRITDYNLLGGKSFQQEKILL